MKKLIVCLLAVMLILSFATACKKKPKEVPPPPPQTQEQPKVEKVEAPVVQEPQLTEEELFLQKSLDQINREKPLGTIYFDYDRAIVRDDARAVLDGNAAWLKKFKTAKIMVEGHCDERGTEEYNLALGEKRAKAAQDYLLSTGVAADRLKIISYGKSQPINPGHDESAWQMNRRAQFLVIEK
ncbi:MAG TPA: peptidoglycan-associated lipoprotein Pal [Candidatus Aminicenantes bacterium]|nr:peptidoglycan-associated lipoprotein Pal [Candidatus Aminicenantes bacterium]HRY64352.1 peptidoglycan-associated lipoprotein Pal [Candidatus Aminicenantes bacterium]HRZ71265.1 peptidoglycan-associated lipoprotein Pal [Candidatus Aminicenantes bacterium]